MIWGERENVEDLKSGDKIAITPTHLFYDSFEWILFFWKNLQYSAKYRRVKYRRAKGKKLNIVEYFSRFYNFVFC